MSKQLSRINHVIVLMLENRSFDHMLGYLYADAGNRSPRHQPFEGLTGTETNPDPSNTPIKVFPITPDLPHAYFMPGANPGEGYRATNAQLYGTIVPPATRPAISNQGFVTDFSSRLEWLAANRPKSIIPGTTPASIMGCFTPATLPILSGLAKGFAVCDHWFGSAPTETMPNRAFALAATSQGHLDDATKSFTVASIVSRLTAASVSWGIYGFADQPLTRHNFPDTLAADDSHFGTFSTFTAAAAAGTLPAFTFLEPGWSGPQQNDQHPVSDVALGEQLIHDVYEAVRTSPAWNESLLIITYDEHGGCFDHVPPPWTAAKPDTTMGEFGFDFGRFGPRVPAVLVSPWIEPGTVFRVRADQTPLDHTAILKTLEKRWKLPHLTKRDAAAPDLGAVLTAKVPRTDDPLQGIAVPVSNQVKPNAHEPTHLQRVLVDLVARLPVPAVAGGEPADAVVPATHEACAAFIRQRTAAWLATPRVHRTPKPRRAPKTAKRTR